MMHVAQMSSFFDTVTLILRSLPFLCGELRSPSMLNPRRPCRLRNPAPTKEPSWVPLA